MARIACALALGCILLSAIGCATPPTYYDYGSPVVTGGTPYNPQPMYVQPGTVVQPGMQPTVMQPGMTTTVPNGYVGQPTLANPARMQPIPNNGSGN